MRIGHLPILLALLPILIYIIYMVTVLTTKNLKFKVNAKDHNPPHVHVEGGGCSVRINLITLDVMDDETDFSNRSLRMIIEFIIDNRDVLLEKWIEYHGED